MKVMILITDTRRGGTPNKMARLAEVAKERGVEISFVSVMTPGPVLLELESKGIRTYSLQVRSRRDALKALRRSRGLISHERPDLIQTALWHADLLGRLACLGTSVPVVNGHEGIDEDKSRGRILVDQLTHRLARHHCATSRAVAERVHQRDGIPIERIKVIPNAVDPDRWTPEGRRDETRTKLGIPLDAKVVGWVGRLHAVKDLACLFEAVSMLGSYWLALAGWGPEATKVPMWSRRYGLEDRVVSVGEIDDVAPLLEAFDVFCLTSRGEGTPMALIEAMAAGLPVVAPRVGGIPELVSDGVDGLLIPPGEPNATARAIERAVKDPQLGANAAAAIKSRFSTTRMVDDFQSLWESVVRSS